MIELKRVEDAQWELVRGGSFRRHPCTGAPRRVGILLLVGFVLSAWGQRLAASVDAGVSPLAPARSVERRIAPGEVHRWQVDLEGVEPALLTVEQLGVDVTVELIAPAGGTSTAEEIIVDSPQDRRGTERLLIEPAAAGRVRVEIRAREAGAPPGAYRILLQPVALDPDRLAGERAMTAAGRAYLTGGAEGWRTARDSYLTARAHWRRAGERRREAESLYAVAVLHRLLDETGEALAAAREVLGLWGELEDPLWEANTLNEIGLLERLAGTPEAARASFAAAAELHQENGERFREAVARANLCLMDLIAGLLRTGAACYEAVLPLLGEASAVRLEATVHSNLGRVYDLLGEPRQALASYRMALEGAASAGDPRAEARALNNLAVLRQETGDLQGALADFARALAHFEELEDRRWQARVLSNLGLAYEDLGEPRRALPHYHQALALRREVGDRDGEAATSTALGQLHNRLGRPEEALRLHRAALDLYRATENPRGAAVTLTQIGRAQAAVGDLTAAEASLSAAVEQLHAVEDPGAEAAARLYLAEVRRRSGEPEAAIGILEAALPLARAAGHRSREAEILYALAHTHRRLGKLEEARREAEMALALVEGLRERIRNPHLRASFASVQPRVYELLVDLAMVAHQADGGDGHDRAALELSERARARSLVELLAEAGAGPDRGLNRGADPALLERRRELLERLSAKADRSLDGALPSGEERAAWEAELEALRREIDLLETRLRTTSPGWAELAAPRPLSVAEIQGQLDPDTLLLAFALGEERSFLWVVSRREVASFELPARLVLEAAVRDVHSRLATFDPRARGEHLAAASELSQTLLGAVANRLPGKRLVIVADGALHYLPFAALPLPATEPGARTPAFLIDHHEVVHLPAASVLPWLRQADMDHRAEERRAVEAGPPTRRWLAVLADPVLGPGDSRVRGGPAADSSLGRLPWSRAEAEALGALAPPGETLALLGFEASRSRLLEEDLSSYRAVHFATHGVLDTENPVLSGLVLSRLDEAGRPRQGFVGLDDIYGLRLDAEVVVLSGCRTALGREMRGEGLVGLTRGFLYAGSPRVVASLWQVDDRATSALMEHFYRAWWQQGLAPAAALREAQQWVAGQRRWRDPAFWGAWVLVGEWR